MEQKKIVKEVGLYFILTFLITWLLWLPSVLNAMDYQVPVFLLIISMMASFTPSIVGLILLKRSLGDQFKAHLKERFSLRFNKLWLFIIPIYFFDTGGLSYYLTYVFDQRFNPTNVPPVWMVPLVFLQILFIGGAFGEELGWRGFAYPRMVKLMSPFKTTLLLGALWSLWHLPLFFMENTVQSNLPMYQFMLQNTLITFIYTWLYQKSKGSLWLIIYLHAIANTTAAVLPYWQSNTGRWINFIILLITVIVLQFANKKEIPQN